MTDTLICPNCSYENIVVSCGFCIQCGFDTKRRDDYESNTHDSPSLETEFTRDGALGGGTAIAEAPVETATADVAEPTTLAEIVNETIRRNRYASEEIDGGWRIEIPLEGLRRQRLFVTRGKSSDRIRLLSLCGTARPEMATKLLEMNNSLPLGAFAISKVGERHLIVLTDTMPAELVSVDQLEYALVAIARTSDALEQKLKPGEDQM